MKITKRQLRRIISEAVEGPMSWSEHYVAPTVPDEVYSRIQDITRSDRQDHLFDLVDALEDGDPDISLDILLKNLKDAEHEQTVPEDELDYTAGRPWEHN